MKMQMFFLAMLIACISCNNQPGNGTHHDEEKGLDIACTCPQCVIVLQPYNDFTEQEAKKWMPVLQKHFDELLYGHWMFKVTSPKEFPKEAYIQERDRYRAISILNYEKTLVQKHEVIIGLTHYLYILVALHRKLSRVANMMQNYHKNPIYEHKRNKV